MTTAFYTHAAGLAHETPPGHPEQIARLSYIHDRMDASEFDTLDRREPPVATDAQLLLAHPQRYIDRIRETAPDSGYAALDGDTYMSPGSLESILRAVGGNVDAVDQVMTGAADNAFVAMRPPGHHAETETPMGFCYFGSVVIGARHALAAHKIDRVAIVDFDVHHGNGTQDLVWNDPKILFASSHQMPLYPGSGAAHETGAHDNVVNLPLPPGTEGGSFRQKFGAHILPRVDAFKPELIMISAGFDAHRADPLANLNLEEDDFAWVTHAICDLADTHCNGRVVSTLEGGYDLHALAASTAAHVSVLMARGGTAS